MIKKLFIFCYFLLNLNADINVAVSANLSFVIDDLIKEFNKENNIKVNITLGGSGKLSTQIRNKAPYDLFLSANMKYPNILYKEKIAITKPICYAKGSLVYLSKKELKCSKIDSFLLNAKKIAIANPKTAPYGKATIEAFLNKKILDKIKNRFIYAESISQTLIYTLKGADIGVVAKSLLYSSKMKRFKKNRNWCELDSKYYSLIEQGVVLLKRAKKDAKVFYDFILSKKAKEIFKRYGYVY